MARDELMRRVHGMVKVTRAIGHEIRMTVVLNALAAPDGIAASDAYPDTVSPPARGPHKDKLSLLLKVDRPSKNEDAVYSVPSYLRRPLREVVDALDRLSAAAATRRASPAHVIVTLAEDGSYVVDGQPVDGKRLSTTIKRALEPDD